ncbi:FG-GAP repeat domain-containing protein [Cognatishimia activa]|uniref:FG-GAP repeat n=1 Tax=Cognatishimia activa TaxID=1715691 RepID=A0A0P1ISH3_9RHOB|nr:VCBS repeat-containing protein [Cognatishimia activa]CUI65511.1 FG-GAP repeat [Cognatishimia activa]CUK26422.1 FG-GAP repeat [Cognatishimia activa]
MRDLAQHLTQSKARRQPLRQFNRLFRRALPVSAFVAILMMPLSATAEIKSARYLNPTDRYGHKVLGAEGEYTTLEVTLRGGKRLALAWEDTVVFEDTAPRLVDLDGDGAPEVIAVQSHQNGGAQVAVYQFKDGKLSPMVSNPFIGTRFRWLAVVGAADLDGDGHMEIAYVDRPHLAKTLRILRFKQEGDKSYSLTPVAQRSGVTNHRIGQDYISGGIRDCGKGPEMIVADANWRNILSVTFDGKTTEVKRLGPFTGRSSITAATSC